MPIYCYKICIQNPAIYTDEPLYVMLSFSLFFAHMHVILFGQIVFLPQWICSLQLIAMVEELGSTMNINGRTSL